MSQVEDSPVNILCRSRRMIEGTCSNKHFDRSNFCLIWLPLAHINYCAEYSEYIDVYGWKDAEFITSRKKLSALSSIYSNCQKTADCSPLMNGCPARRGEDLSPRSGGVVWHILVRPKVGARSARGLNPRDSSRVSGFICLRGCIYSQLVVYYQSSTVDCVTATVCG